MKMKKIVAVILVVIMLLLSAGCSGSKKEETPAVEETTTVNVQEIIDNAVLQYPSKNETFRYTIYDTYIAISEYLGKGGEVKIPATLEGLPVYVIEARVFEEPTTEDLMKDPSLLKRPRITSVQIPEGIAFIHENAFRNCEYLTEVTIPKSVKSIGAECFRGCINLRKLTLNEGLTEIKEAAFQKTSSLSEVILPEGLTVLEASVFRESGLYNISFPSSLAVIPDTVCENCENLTSVRINEFDASTIQTAVEETEEEEKEEKEEDKTEVEEFKYERRVGGKAFAKCPSLKNVWIPGNFTEIAGDAFADSNDGVVLFSYTRSTAAVYASKQLLDFQLTTKEDFSKLYNETTNAAQKAEKPLTSKPAGTTTETKK